MVSRASRRAVAAPKGRGWSYNGWQNKFEDRGKYHGKQKPRNPAFPTHIRQIAETPNREQNSVFRKIAREATPTRPEVK